MNATATRPATQGFTQDEAPAPAPRIYTEDETRAALAADMANIKPDQVILDADTFDVTRHDGTITITNGATGRHKTFKVHTVRDGNLAGKRIVKLLVANTHNAMMDYWQAFAFADDFGVKVWRKNRGDGERTDWEKFAAMLENPKAFAAKGCRYQVGLNCRRCGRALTASTSLDLGVGPECAKKMGMG